MRRVRSLSIAAIVAVAACSGSTEPGSGAPGTYRLTMIGSDSLPALVVCCNVYTLAGSLSLASGGEFTETSRDSVYNAWDGVNYSWRVLENTDRVGTWRADGSVLTLTDTTGGLVNATQIIGTIAPHTVLVTWDSGYGQYRYER